MSVFYTVLILILFLISELQPLPNDDPNFPTALSTLQALPNIDSDFSAIRIILEVRNIFSEVIKYLSELCANLGIRIPQTQKARVSLFSKIALRYVDESYVQKKAKNDMPSNTEDWELLFYSVELKYGELEPFLKATKLKKIPRNEFEWTAVKKVVETLIKDCFDFEIEKSVQLILKRKKNSAKEYKIAFTDLAQLYPFPSPPHSLEAAIEKCRYLSKKCGELDNECRDLKAKCDEHNKYVWKVVPRVFFDDVEATYKSDYESDKKLEQLEEENLREYNKLSKYSKSSYIPLFTTPRKPSDDPKRIRIEKRKNFWIWLLKNRKEEIEIKAILKKMELQFRKMQKPPIPINNTLTETEELKFEDIKIKTALAIAEVHEAISFIIHGNQAIDLFKGQLEELNLFGENIDPYIVPVINALVPLVDPNKPIVTFEKTTEKP